MRSAKSPAADPRIRPRSASCPGGVAPFAVDGCSVILEAGPGGFAGPWARPTHDTSNLNWRDLSMQHKDQNFSGTTEALDGNEYVNCKFKNCTMVYRGGGIPVINGCNFEDCKWQFEEAAERTLVFLKAVCHGMGPGGRQLVESTLNEILTPPKA